MKRCGRYENNRFDIMRYYILARVFRGELGINDPTREKAMALLRQSIIRGDANDP